MNDAIGRAAAWLVLLDVLISAGNALSRYTFSLSSNAWLEIQWYLFAGMFMLGAPHTLRLNEHVRVDLLYGRMAPRWQDRIDLVGGLLFLLPMCLLISWMSWPVFWNSWLSGEGSSNPGGLIRWPVKLLLPLGFFLLGLQGVSEIIKRVAAMRGRRELIVAYEKPLQ